MNRVWFSFLKIRLPPDRGLLARRPLQNLAIAFEAGAECGVVEILEGEIGIEGEGGGGAGGLAEDHEDGFHADGSIGDVGG